MAGVHERPGSPTSYGISRKNNFISTRARGLELYVEADTAAMVELYYHHRDIGIHGHRMEYTGDKTIQKEKPKTSGRGPLPRAP